MNIASFFPCLNNQFGSLLTSLFFLMAFAAGLPRLYALSIVPIFDSSIQNDPQAATIEATINSAITVYESNFSDPVNVSILFVKTNSGLGMSSSYFISVLYSDYRAHLLYNATTEDDNTAFAHLPNQPNNPVNNNQMVDLHVPLARATGFTPDFTPLHDGIIWLNITNMNLSAAQTDPSKYSLFSVVSHEIDEVLGFGSALNNLNNGDPPPLSAVSPEDLFRYDQMGARSFTTTLSATSYFSLDGITPLARFNQTEGGDFGDWYGDQILVQNASLTAGASPVLTIELRVLDVIGYHPVNAPIWADFASSDTGDGRFFFPFNRLANAINAVVSGGTIEIKTSISHEKPITLSKPMTIKAFNGPVVVGQ